MRSVQKVTVDPIKKVTVQHGHFQHALELGVPNGEVKPSISCPALSMLGLDVTTGWRWVARAESKEEAHSSLIQTGVGPSLDLKLVGDRWPTLDDPWLLLDAQWWAAGHWRSMV